MNVVRVFPRKTSLTPSDKMAFIGDPPMLRPEADEVHVSVTFTWDISEGERLAQAWGNYYPVVKIGGPAFGNVTEQFTPGMYLKNGVTFTTRGCNRKCPWCLVPSREGNLIEIYDFAPGYIIQDNNSLQASNAHQDRVFAMLDKQPRAAVFSGGLDARLVNVWFADKIKSIRLNQLFLAADTAGALRPLERAIKILSLPIRKIRVYVLIGFDDETIEQATERLETVWKFGGLPFAQLYQPPDRFIDYSPQWKQLARTWSRPAAMFSLHSTRQPNKRLHATADSGAFFTQGTLF